MTIIPKYCRQAMDTVPRPATFRGMLGFWTVPQNWYTWTDSDQQTWTSPNQDHSQPVYAVGLDDSGYLMFQDLARNVPDRG